MLTSLFGDLGDALDPRRRSSETPDAPDAGFAATAIMESVASGMNSRGQIVDRHSHDLVVSGSPAQAIREHFADTRADLDTATSLITLLDPAGVWASAVIKALSDAGGRPIERLHLRERSTLRTLATIERTTLVRRFEDTLRIYHADVRAPGSDNAEIPIALMERSQMTTVVIGPLQPHAIDALLSTLLAAAMLPTWRCPNLLFMLPPNAVWIANKVNAIAWPGRLHVHVISESMSGASSVWNAMLGMWNQVKAQPGWDPVDLDTGVAAVAELAASRSNFEPGAPRSTGAGDPTAAAATVAPAEALSPLSPLSPPTPLSSQPSRPVVGALDPSDTQTALAGMLALEGLIACAVVDATTGLVLAHEQRSEPPVNIHLAAAASAQALRAHRQAARSMGLGDQVDEVMSSGGSRQQVMRTVSRHPELFIFALLDRQRTNLALVRFQLMEAERAMA